MACQMKEGFSTQRDTYAPACDSRLVTALVLMCLRLAAARYIADPSAGETSLLHVPIARTSELLAKKAAAAQRTVITMDKPRVDISALGRSVACAQYLAESIMSNAKVHQRLFMSPFVPGGLVRYDTDVNVDVNTAAANSTVVAEAGLMTAEQVCRFAVVPELRLWQPNLGLALDGVPHFVFSFLCVA